MRSENRKWQKGLKGWGAGVKCTTVSQLKVKEEKNPEQKQSVALTAEDHSRLEGQRFKTAVNKHRAGSTTS